MIYVYFNIVLNCRKVGIVGRAGLKGRQNKQLLTAQKKFGP